MMKKIIVRSAKPISSMLASSDLPPILKQIYANRDIQTVDQVQTALTHLLPYHDLSNIELAVNLLWDALKTDQSILVIGDYDADGATSVALSVRALRRLGAKQVDFFIPDRFTEGHGLTPDIVEKAHAQAINLIMTVDNGMASHDAVDLAKKYGIKVIITDHHLPTEVMLEADAVVNPNQKNDAFPSKNLAGVGVVFYLMLALRAKLRAEHWFDECGIVEPNLAEYLDLVALGTVADMVPLDQNNRILVDQGVRRIRAGKCCPGISALLASARRHLAKIKAEDLGFSIAPRLNAAGRLKHMELGVRCLLSDDWVETRQIAANMEALNQERRQIETAMYDNAQRMLKKHAVTDAAQHNTALCLYNEDWHPGVIGILATRLKNHVNVPVAVFTRQDSDCLRGSIRSIEGIHIYEILSDIAGRYPDLIQQFGGHAMAAGLSVKNTDYDQFQSVFSEIIRCKLNASEMEFKLLSDGELKSEELQLEFANFLNESGPWGKDFPEPMFDGIFYVKNKRLLKDKHLKMVLSCQDKTYNAIAFNVDKKIKLENGDSVNIVYRLSINHYQGRDELQLLVEHLESIF